MLDLTLIAISVLLSALVVTLRSMGRHLETQRQTTDQLN